jgi:hypothetical protein
MNTTENHANSKRFRITVNGQDAALDRPQISVVELWAMFSLDPSMEMVLEGIGNAPDRVLEADAVLDLHPDHPPRLYSRPLTNFG